MRWLFFSKDGFWWKTTTNLRQKYLNNFYLPRFLSLNRFQYHHQSRRQTFLPSIHRSIGGTISAFRRLDTSFNGNISWKGSSGGRFANPILIPSDIPAFSHPSYPPWRSGWGRRTYFDNCVSQHLSGAGSSPFGSVGRDLNLQKLNYQ